MPAWRTSPPTETEIDMNWSDNFSHESVNRDLLLRGEPGCVARTALERKLRLAVAACAANRFPFGSTRPPTWEGSQEQSYETAVGYAMVYQRCELAIAGRAWAERALAARRAHTVPFPPPQPSLSEDEWRDAADRVCRDARLPLGAELRAGETSSFEGGAN